MTTARREHRAGAPQGRSAAGSGVRAARRLGIARGSVLWFDLENFDAGRTRCRRSAERFVAGWTERLHAEHYRAGLYSSASSGISAEDAARRAGITVPDYLWIAEWNGRDTVRSSYISRAGWWPHRRVHQYRGSHHERHGGVRIDIDSNYLSTGAGTVGGRAARPCGVRVSFRSYPRAERGDHGARVRAGQCLLRRQRVYTGRLTGHVDRHTEAAVRRFQRRHGVPVTGALTRRTWTALLSVGGRPLLKYGAGGNAVRRLQRALDAASDAHQPVDGVFAGAEMIAVRQLQRRHHQPATGVVTPKTWRLLQNGRLVGRIGHRSGGHSGIEGLPGIAPTPFGIGAAGPR
jgi:peptidoglycan hydrolase-like protein with peptidoglycan-binding domain